MRCQNFLGIGVRRAAYLTAHAKIGQIRSTKKPPSRAAGWLIRPCFLLLVIQIRRFHVLSVSVRIGASDCPAFPVRCDLNSPFVITLPPCLDVNFSVRASTWCTRECPV